MKEHNKQKEYILKINDFVADKLKQKQVATALYSIDVNQNNEFSIRNNEVQNYLQDQSVRFSIQIHQDNKKSSSSCQGADLKLIEQTIDNTLDIIKFVNQDPFSVLADKEMLATDIQDFQKYSPSPFTNDQYIETAKQLENRAYAYSKIINNIEEVSFSYGNGYSLLANTYGFLGLEQDSYYQYYLSVVAQKQEEKFSGYDYCTALDYNQLKSFDELIENSCQLTIDLLEKGTIETGKYPVVFNQKCAKSIIGSLLSAINGHNIYKKSSFLENAIDQQIFPNWLTVTEQPFLMKQGGSSSFDSEGVKTNEKIIIENGVLNQFLLDCYSAKKLSRQSTGNAGGYTNVIFSNSGESEEQLIKQMDKGIFVGNLIGRGLDLTTGDYSIGGEGYWVENGKKQYAINEFTIAFNCSDFYKNIQAIGSNIDESSSLKVGSILIDNITISSK